MKKKTNKTKKQKQQQLRVTNYFPKGTQLSKIITNQLSISKY